MGDRNCTNYSSTKSTPTTPTAALPGRAVFTSPSLPAGRDFGRGTMLQSLGWRDCHCFYRFASLGLKSGIAARIATVLAFWLHRFASLGLKSRIDAGIAPILTFWLHRFASLGSKSRIAAAPSLRQRRLARLQRRRGVQAGTGCHEGGIILSKKPPEWRLSTPHQRSASDSNFLCRKTEQPACSKVVGCRRVTY